MTKLLILIKSPATWVIILSAIIGGINAILPLLHPKVAEYASIVLALVGTVLHGLEKHEALMSPPPEK